jgi:hypothetical protein
MPNVVVFKISQKKAPAMINIDKLMKLRLILKEIIFITKNTEFKNDNQLSVKICQLLSMLVHMQSLNISIRTELIENFFSIRPDFPHEITNQIKNGVDNIILFDRRKANPDRRKSHTNLANDRRIGIADRRKSA